MQVLSTYLSLFLSHVPTWAEFLAGLPVVFSVSLIDGLLSVDNGLIIAARAAHLPEAQRNKAINIGMIGALVIRLAALFGASLLISNPWVKLLGGAYLVRMMCVALGVAEKGEEEQVAETHIVGFRSVVVSIMIADFVFSIDNIVAAAAMSPKLWVVWSGVFVSIIILMFAVRAFVKLLEKLPILENIAYVLVGFIGLQLFAEYFFDISLKDIEKFGAVIGILVFGIIYDKVGLVNLVFKPVFTWLGQVMANVAELVDSLLLPLTAAYQCAAAAVRK